MLDVFRKMVLLTSSAADEQGNITRLHITGEVPEKIGDKRLVLHEKYQLSGAVDPTWQERVLFNPLAENVSATTITPSLEWFLRGAAFRLNVTFMVLMKEVLRIAASPAEQEKLSPSQLEFVTKLTDIDGPVADFFDKSIANMAAKGEWVFIKMFPKHAGTIGGIKYNRTCHVSFPIYEELLGDRKFGKSTAMPKGASQKLASVMQLLLPDIAIVDGYSAGSNSRMAPFCEAVVASLVKLYSCISRHQRLWSNIWPDPEVDKLTADRMGIVEYQWMDYLRNTDALVDEIRAIPSAGGFTLPATPTAQPLSQAFTQVTRQEVMQPPPPALPPLQQPPQQQYYQQPVQQPQQQYYQQPVQQPQYYQQPPQQQYDPRQQNQPPSQQTSNLTMAQILANRDKQTGGSGGGRGGYYDDRRDRDYGRNDYPRGGGGSWAS